MTTPPALSPSEYSATAKNPVHVGHLSKLLLQSLRRGEKSHPYSDEKERIPTGLSELDKKLCGGFLPGDLVVVAGRPGTGAELLSFDMATELARVRLAPSLICSSNFPPSFLVGHILSHISKVSCCRIARCKLSEEELFEVAKAVEEIEDAPLYIRCKPLASAEWMCREAHSMHEKIAGLRLIVIELPAVSGSRIQTSLLRKVRSSMELSMEAAASLKGLAKETGATVILVAGITRYLERRDDKRPSLPDLRNGSVLVRFADQILMLYREEIYYPETQDRDIAEISIAATWGTPSSTVRVRFSGEQFSDLT